MMDKDYVEKFIGEKMKSKISRYPIFGTVIHESLAGIYRLLEKTKRAYTLRAYVRKTQDGFDENVLHIQMHFKNTQERDALWNQASGKLVENIQGGMKKTSDPNEKLEIENILCAVTSELLATDN